MRSQHKKHERNSGVLPIVSLVSISVLPLKIKHIIQCRGVRVNSKYVKKTV